MSCVGMLILCVVFLRYAGGIRIAECSQSQWLDIREDDRPTSVITCDGLSSTTTMTWTLSINGKQTYKQNCKETDRMCTSLEGDVIVVRDVKQSNSQLSIVKNHRTLAGNGMVTCQEEGQSRSATCKINIIHPADVFGCEVHVKGWAASSSCQYWKAFSSNGTFTCTWYRQLSGQSSRDYVATGTLTKTKHTVKSLQHYEGVCRLPATQLPETAAHERYSYSLDFLPGPVNHLAGNILLQEPGDPVTNCSEYVQEGRIEQCDCLVNDSSPGRPLPAVHWQGLQPGQPLVIENTTRDDIGTVFSCQLSWGPPLNTSTRITNYTLNVAYGPDAVNFTVGKGSDSFSFTLMCTAFDVNPSASFNWTGVSCSSTTDNITNSTCEIKLKSEDVGDAVICTARNSKYPQDLHQTESFTIQFDKLPPGIHSTFSGTGRYRLPKIGVLIAALALILFVVIVIAVVLSRKLNDSAENTADNPTATSITAAHNANNTTTQESSSSISQEPSSTISQEPSSTITQEPSSTISQEPSSTEFSSTTSTARSHPAGGNDVKVNTKNTPTEADNATTGHVICTLYR